MTVCRLFLPKFDPTMVRSKIFTRPSSITKEADSFARNVELEYERNRERYALLRWAQTAFDRFRVVPPGAGIVHQVNLEYIASVVFRDGDTIYPFHPYTQESAQPVTPGAVTEYQIQVFPTLATVPKGDRLRVTVATADTPHLVPVPAEMLQLTGGIYQIQRSPSASSSLTVELRPAGSAG